MGSVDVSMTDIGGVKGKVTSYEVWVVPGKEQTLADIIEKFKDRVIEVDEPNNRALILRENYG